MHRLALVALLAGCPAKHGPTPPPPPVAGVGCPAANGVFVASWVQPPQGEQGHTGWVLPLYDAKVDSVQGRPDYQPLDANGAAAAGVPAAPQHLWLVLPSGTCEAKLGGYYAAAIETPANISYGVELTGCPAPQDPNEGVAIALVSDAPPTQCGVHLPRPVAQRLGQMDQAQRWQRPVKETPIPDAFAAIVPQRECPSASCEKLWSIAQVEIDGKPVAWTGAVNWLEIPPGAPPESQCTWKADTFSGTWVADGNGAPAQVTTGMDHPLVLTAVLADKSGAHVVLAEGTGEYTAYDYAAGQVTPTHHLVWLVAPPEAYAALDKLGPECGGPQ